jgi:hypothetical protein
MATMDFIDGLPQSRQFNCILVVVDKLSKYAHFMPLSHPYNVVQVEDLFVDLPALTEMDEICPFQYFSVKSRTKIEKQNLNLLREFDQIWSKI